MSDVDPQAVAAATIASQADSVTGTDSAGIYGDPAGAGQRSAAQSPEQVASDLAAAGAQPHSVDTDALLRRIQALEAAANEAAAAVAPAAVVPLKLGELVLGAAAPAVVHAFELAEERLHALEHPGEDTTSEE